MRSIPRGSFERLSSLDALWQAYRLCRRGKSRQPAMAGFDLDMDQHLIGLHRDLLDGRYQPSPWRLRLVRDPKLRLIAAPDIRDRVLHRALLDEIGPHFERGYIEHSYTALPGRGPHRAVLQYLAWLRRYRYRMHLDVSRYFPSIHHPTLAGLLFRRVRDRDTRALIWQLLRSGGAVYHTPLARQVLDTPPDEDRGLSLGSYFSQWCGTYYLDGLDHHAKRVLKVPAYLRYMDDFVLFGDDPGVLTAQREMIETWLWEERRLALKRGCGVVRPGTEPAIFLGYRISRAGLTAGRKLRRSFRKRVRRAAEQGPEALLRTIRSYRGLLLF